MSDDEKTISVEISEDAIRRAERFDRGAGFVLTLMAAAFFGTCMLFELAGWW